MCNPSPAYFISSENRIDRFDFISVDALAPSFFSPGAEMSEWTNVCHQWHGSTWGYGHRGGQWDKNYGEWRQQDSREKGGKESNRQWTYVSHQWHESGWGCGQGGGQWDKINGEWRQQDSRGEARKKGRKRRGYGGRGRRPHCSDPLSSPAAPGAIATLTKAAQDSHRVPISEHALMGTAAASAPIEDIGSDYVQIVQEEEGGTYAVLAAANKLTKAGKGSCRVSYPDSAWMGAAAASAPKAGIEDGYVQRVQVANGETHAVLDAKLAYRPDSEWHG